MTVADFMATGTDTPLYFQAPSGLCRVIGVIARYPMPQVIYLTHNGQHVFISVLWSTKLQPLTEEEETDSTQGSPMQNP